MTTHPQLPAVSHREIRASPLESMKNANKLAEGEGFEPTLGLLLSLISSQVPSTTQPPFHPFIYKHLATK